MLPYIWSGIIIFSVVYSLLNGTTDQLSQAILSSAGEAIELVIAMCGTVCLWSGIMEIADKSGAAGKVSELLSPMISRLFPDLDKNGKAYRAISMNLTANLLGLGNAATPLGVKAMQELQRERSPSGCTQTADRNMIMFVILNTTSIQLIPTMIMSILQSNGSSDPTGIIPYVWGASAAGLAAGVLSVKLFTRKRR